LISRDFLQAEAFKIAYVSNLKDLLKLYACILSFTFQKGFFEMLSCRLWSKRLVTWSKQLVYMFLRAFRTVDGDKYYSSPRDRGYKEVQF